MDVHDTLLAAHVVAGSLGLVLGPLAMWAERWPPHHSRAGAVYHLSVLAVSLTAVGLVALDWRTLWWLLPLATLSYTLALLGLVAPRWSWRGWQRAYAHGQGGSYIALVTALLVVSLEGAASAAGWVIPTLVGLPLIERRVVGLRKRSHQWVEPRRAPRADHA